jgi:hypothetical protein
VVQQNASLVEEAAAATESMKSQAASLLQMVSRFHLGEAQPAITPLHPIPHPQAQPAPDMPAPQPIPLKRASAKLPPVLQDAVPPLKAPASNGEWKEF